MNRGAGSTVIIFKDPVKLKGVVGEAVLIRKIKDIGVLEGMVLEKWSVKFKISTHRKIIQYRIRNRGGFR